MTLDQQERMSCQNPKGVGLGLGGKGDEKIDIEYLQHPE